MPISTQFAKGSNLASNNRPHLHLTPSYRCAPPSTESESLSTCEQGWWRPRMWRTQERPKEFHMAFWANEGSFWSSTLSETFLFLVIYRNGAFRAPASWYRRTASSIARPSPGLRSHQVSSPTRVPHKRPREIRSSVILLGSANCSTSQDLSWWLGLLRHAESSRSSIALTYRSL